MHHITLDSETDFDGWRKAARALALNDVKPSDVTWNVAGGAPELFAPTAPPLEAPEGTFSVSARFVELAQIAILHRNPERFALLYRLLWRLRHDHDLLDIATDPDVARDRRDGEGRPPRRAQDACLRPLPRSRPRAANRTSSPGSSRSITSSNWPRRSSRAVSPTCPGRS